MSRVEKEITCKQHMNTKHSKTDTMHGTDSNRLGASFFCDECEYSCHNKKSMKTHKAKNHEGVSHQCKTCNEKFKLKKDLDSHVKELHGISKMENDKNVCTCTNTTVCDKCLVEDGWVY